MITDRTIENGEVCYFRQLTSIDEVLLIADGINSLDEEEQRRCASINNDFGFTHTNSLKEAIDLCRYGWSEGRERVLETMARLGIDDSLANLGDEIDFQLETAGDEPDIDRYLAGDPENMMNYRIEDSITGRNVKLLVNSSQAAYVDPTIITRRGIAVVAAIETAATAGYGVSLDMVERSSPSTTFWGETSATIVEYRIPIAEAGGYVNIDTLTFTVTHPSFLRRLMFALNENEPAEIREEMGYMSGRGYGRPEPIKLREGEEAIVIDKDDGLLKSDDEILPFATDIAKKLIRQS